MLRALPYDADPDVQLPTPHPSAFEAPPYDGAIPEAVLRLAAERRGQR